MPRELRIAATITVPDDLFDQARAIVAVAPALEQMTKALKAIDPEADVSADLVTPKPREPKPAMPFLREEAAAA